MINGKLPNLTTIETIMITGGEKYICLCGQYRIRFYDESKKRHYAAQYVKEEVQSKNECSSYCSGHGYNDSYCLKIKEGFKYYDNGHDNLTL